MYERRMVQIRMHTRGVEKLDQIAKDTGTDRSTVIRACLAIALADQSKVVAKIERDREGAL